MNQNREEQPDIRGNLGVEEISQTEQGESQPKVGNMTWVENGGTRMYMTLDL